MGYDIYIGDTEMEAIEQYEDEEIYVTLYMRNIKGQTVYYQPVVRREVKLPDAPTFPGDEMTGNSNNRHPGYLGWSDFVDTVGLQDFFFNKQTGLMREHPGHVSLQPEHLEIIQQALISFRQRYPFAIPQFVQKPEEGHLARLIWLEWWVRWALTNCEHAAIYNF